jgi:hypothetical protein
MRELKLWMNPYLMDAYRIHYDDAGDYSDLRCPLCESYEIEEAYDEQSLV